MSATASPIRSPLEPGALAGHQCPHQFAAGGQCYVLIGDYEPGFGELRQRSTHGLAGQPRHGVQATVSVVVQALGVGTFSTTASISSDQADPTPGDNSATVSVIIEPVVDLAVSIAANPSPVAVGQNLVYTVDCDQSRARRCLRCHSGRTCSPRALHSSRRPRMPAAYPPFRLGLCLRQSAHYPPARSRPFSSRSSLHRRRVRFLSIRHRYRPPSSMPIPRTTRRRSPCRCATSATWY